MPLNIPVIPLQYFLIPHFVLATWASLYPWLGEVYLVTNYFVLIIGIWALRDQATKEPVQYLLCGHLFTVLNDIILFGMYFAPANSPLLTKNTAYATRFRFTAAMAIINLLLKPVSAFFMYREWQTRKGGDQYENFGEEASAPAAPSKQPPPASSGGYMPPASANNPYQSSNY